MSDYLGRAVGAWAVTSVTDHADTHAIAFKEAHLEPANSGIDVLQKLDVFLTMLQTEPDHTILLRKNALVQQIWRALLNEMPSESPIPFTELWKGFDPDDRKDQLKVNKLALDSIASSGNQWAELLAVQVTALSWLDDLWDVEEIKRARPKIVQMMKTPKEHIKQDESGKKLSRVWDGILFAGGVGNWLLEHQQKHGC